MTRRPTPRTPPPAVRHDERFSFARPRPPHQPHDLAGRSVFAGRQQVNRANNGDLTITKTYIADPSRSVMLVQSPSTTSPSAPLRLYADYHPQLDNDGMDNTSGTDTGSGDLVPRRTFGVSALASSTASATNTGYVGLRRRRRVRLTSASRSAPATARRARRATSTRCRRSHGGHRFHHLHARAGLRTSQAAAIPTRRRPWRPVFLAAELVRGRPRTPGSAACTPPAFVTGSRACRRSTTSR